MGTETSEGRFLRTHLTATHGYDAVVLTDMSDRSLRRIHEELHAPGSRTDHRHAEPPSEEAAKRALHDHLRNEHEQTTAGLEGLGTITALNELHGSLHRAGAWTHWHSAEDRLTPSPWSELDGGEEPVHWIERIKSAHVAPPPVTDAPNRDALRVTPGTQHEHEREPDGSIAHPTNLWDHVKDTHQGRRRGVPFASVSDADLRRWHEAFHEEDARTGEAVRDALRASDHTRHVHVDVAKAIDRLGWPSGHNRDAYLKLANEAHRALESALSRAGDRLDATETIRVGIEVRSEHWNGSWSEHHDGATARFEADLEDEA